MVYVLLVGVGFAVLAAPYLPPSLDDPERVVAHLPAHPPTSSLWLGLGLEAAGLVALVLLAASGWLLARGSRSSRSSAEIALE